MVSQARWLRLCLFWRLRFDGGVGGWEDGLGAGRRRGKGESRGLLLVLVVPAEMNNPLVVLLSIGLVHRFHFTLVRRRPS